MEMESTIQRQRFLQIVFIYIYIHPIEAHIYKCPVYLKTHDQG